MKYHENKILVNSFFLSHSKMILKENIFNSVTHIKKNILELGRRWSTRKSLLDPSHLTGA